MTQFATLNQFKATLKSTQLVLVAFLLAASCIHTSLSFAGTPVELRKSYAGNLSFRMTGGSFLDGDNCNDDISGRTSSETLSGLPIGSTIKAAWLYWAGSYNPSAAGVNTPDNTITFSSPTGSRSVSASTAYTTAWGEDSTDTPDPNEAYFNNKADVTSFVTGNGSYSVSNLSVHTGNPHCGFNTVIAGWALVIIYEEASEPFRVVNVFDGFTYYYGNQLSLTPSNFTVSSTPSGKHGHITWEGDNSNSGSRNGFTESLKFEGQDLFGGDNPIGNQFNSYSNALGKTTLGLDIDEYDIDSSFISAGANNATTIYSSGSDFVLLTAEVFSITNIPVADLAVTTSNPTGWLQDSTITKKFTVSNNGPNDVPTQSVRFTTTLPSQLSFNGTQGNLKWVCSQSGQQLTCVYQPKLRSGWSDYIDLTLDIAPGTAGQTANWAVEVDHDIAPYDIFDNQMLNDIDTLNVPIGATPVVDLSASSKTQDNLNGDLLLAGDTLQYTITIDDASDLASSGIRVVDDLPANISSYSITALPAGAINNSTTTGGANGTGIIDIEGINLAAGAVEQIIIEVIVDATAPEGASLQNTATLSFGVNSWTVDTGGITVVKPDLTPSTKTASDDNGGFLLPGETVTYTITIDEAKNLDLSGIQVIDSLPAHISSFTVTQIPTGAQDFSLATGGTNNTGLIDIRNINLTAGSTTTITIKVVIADDAIDQANVQNTASLILNSTSWDEISNPLYVTLSSSTPASGNKPLYLVNNNLTRNLPSTDTSRGFFHGQTLVWPITPVLQQDLIIASGNSRLNLAIEGFRTGTIQTRFNAQLYYNDNNGSGNVVISNADIGFGNYRINTRYDLFTDFTLASDVTIPAGSTVFLSVLNTSSNGTNNQFSQIRVHTFNSGFYSAVNLNATTVVNVDDITVWDQTYGDPTGSGNGLLLANSFADNTLYIRAKISDPFGAFDISKADIEVQKADGSFYDFSALPNTNVMTQVDTNSDDTSTSTKTYEIELTLLEENESIGWWQISVTGYEGLEVAPNQVTHQRTNSFFIKPFLPNIALNKIVKVINDPISGSLDTGNKPRAIPGAELRYTINAINTGRGESDNGSITLQDEITTDAELYIGNVSCLNRGPGTGSGPICFEDGANPDESDLTFDFLGLNDTNDDIEFSQDGINFNYEPVDSGDGYDDSIRFIRISPSGVYRKATKDGTETPEFNFSYQVRLH